MMPSSESPIMIRDYASLGTAVFSSTLASHLMTRLVFGDSIWETMRFEKNDDGSSPTTKVNVKAGMRLASEETFRKIVPAWQWVNDLVVVLYFCWSLASGLPIPMFLWAPLGCSFYLTACCYWRQHPWAAEVDTVVLSIMGFLSTINAPRHATNSISMIRLLLNSWLPAPQMALLMQFALEPGFLADSCHRESVTSRQEFVELLLSEVVLLGGLVLAHYKQQGSLYHQIAASIRAETSIQETLSLGDAAKRLLTVTCDACVSLSEELSILKPPASLMHLFGEEDLAGKSFLKYVSEPERLMNFINFSGGDGSSTPSSCHVQMISNSGPFSAEIFHVKICGSVSASASRHFIGIAADPQEKDSVKVDDTSGHDMKFLLGCSAGPENLQRNDRESISTRFWQDLEEISGARLLVDALAPEAGFWVKSASFDFVDVSQTRQEKLPNLLEWVEPSCRQQVHIWVQDHVNAYYCGRSFVQELPAVKFFCPGAESGLLLGRLSAQMQRPPNDGDGGSDDDDGDSESEDLNMQLLIAIKDLRKF